MAQKVGTPYPLFADVEDDALEYLLACRKARAQGCDQATEDLCDQFEKLFPRITHLTTAMGAVGSLARASLGVCSPGFKRTCKEIWARSEDMFVIFADEAQEVTG